MQLTSVTKLAAMTGKGFNTVKRRLESLHPELQDATGNYYDLPKALAAIYGNEKSTGLQDKRTITEIELNESKKERLDLEIETTKKNLVPFDHATQILGNILASLKAKLLAVPTKCEVEFKYATSSQESVEIVRNNIEGVLREISTSDPIQFRLTDTIDSEAPGSPSPTT